MKLLLTSAALALALAATSAHATCVSSTAITAPDPSAGTPCAITATGTTEDIIFAYKSASDVDLLINGVTTLLKNTDPLGTEAVLTGLTVGQTLDLTWKNSTTGDSFQAGVAASDGDQHIAVQSTYADFQTDPPRTYLTQADLGAAYGVMAGIAPLSDWVFAGMEDLLASQAFSDFDYNDLIIGMLGIDPTKGGPSPMTEPATFALLGTGLLGFGLWRKRVDMAAAALEWATRPARYGDE